MSNALIAAVDPKRSGSAVFFVFLIMFGLGALIGALKGGQPASAWYYPSLFVLALFIAFYGRVSRPGNWRKGDLGPTQPDSVAMPLAVKAGAEAGLLVFVMFGLGLGISRSGIMSVGTALFTGVDEYRYRRGLAFTFWPGLILFGVILILLWQFGQMRMLTR